MQMSEEEHAKRAVIRALRKTYRQHVAFAWGMNLLGHLGKEGQQNAQ